MEISTCAKDMVDLLKAGLFEEFRGKYQNLVKEGVHNPFEIAEAINGRIQEMDPGSDSKIIVSQKTNSDKHIVMIMDSSRFFGEAFTVTRQMFVV